MLCDKHRAALATVTGDVLPPRRVVRHAASGVELTDETCLGDDRLPGARSVISSMPQR